MRADYYVNGRLDGHYPILSGATIRPAQLEMSVRTDNSVNGRTYESLLKTLTNAELAFFSINFEVEKPIVVRVHMNQELNKWQHGNQTIIDADRIRIDTALGNITVFSYHSDGRSEFKLKEISYFTLEHDLSPRNEAQTVIQPPLKDKDPRDWKDWIRRSNEEIDLAIYAMVKDAQDSSNINARFDSIGRMRVIREILSGLCRIYPKE